MDLEPDDGKNPRSLNCFGRGHPKNLSTRSPVILSEAVVILSEAKDRSG
jgi:hypothetical protein